MTRTNLTEESMAIMVQLIHTLKTQESISVMEKLIDTLHDPNAILAMALYTKIRHLSYHRGNCDLTGSD